MTELDIKRKASELLQKGRYDDAIGEYQALLDRARKPNPAVLNLIGDIHIKAGNFEVGFESFLTAAKHYTEEGLFHNAIAVGKKILRLDRDQVEVYSMLGNLYARQGLGMDCVKFLSEYSRRKDDSGDYPAALAAFAEACESISDFPDIHLAYADMLERVDRHEDAAACHDAAAQAFEDRGQTAEAEEGRQKARALRNTAGEAPDDSGVQDVNDLMSLRTLEDSAEPPPSGIDADSGTDSEREAFWGRAEEPAGMSEPSSNPEALEAQLPLDIDQAPWAVFNANAHPDIPPPPPLPSSGMPPATVTPIHEVETTEFPVEEVALADTPVEESPLVEPTVHEIPIPEIPAADAGGLSLSEIEPMEAPAEPAVSAPETIAASTASAPTEAAPVAGLDDFFAQSTEASSDEQAVVIGDDFELLREGGDVHEVIADFRDATMEILDLDDHQAHYDLGTTYMEMELFDEAAAEFEIAARGTDFALPSREMLGYCFLRKGHIDMAIKELENGLAIPGFDDRDKLGLLYNLGIACGVLDHEKKAIDYFQRILELDPNFRDTQARLERLVQNSA